MKQISAVKKPDHLNLEEWQIALRKQMGRIHPFRIKNTGSHPVFSEFKVKSSGSGRAYRVVIRGEDLGINYCDCPDFSINTLGTCKHVECVLRRLGRKRETRDVLKKGHVSNHSSVTLRYGLQRKVYFSVGRKAKDALKSLIRKYSDANGYLTSRGFLCFEKLREEINFLNEDVRFHADALTFIAQMGDCETRKNRIDELFPGGARDASWGNLLKVALYSYQREGILFASKAGRALIADEMGLGKTVQAIGTAEVMARSFGVNRVLIVCPSSLKHQWKQEIEKFADRSTQVINGLWHQRRQQYAANAFYKIINYDVIHRDHDSIHRWKPDLIILDEAQRIKNWKTRLARSVKQLSSPHALVLTGTPLENRLEELHSILEFIDRYHLGPLFRFLDRHQIRDKKGKVAGYRDLHALGKTLEPVLIRRKREEVLSQLPQRIDKNYFVEMTREQMQIHDEQKEIVARLVAKWKKYHFLDEKDQKRLMCSLQVMRMVCDSTYLVDKQTIHGKKLGELEVQLREVLEDPETKVVLFSQWTRMGELIKEMLDKNGWKYVYFHGGVPSGKRGELIHSFNEDPQCRLFISTDAGGVGLNLQNASVVINLDLPWNPAVLEQRISRVYRMGQRRAVRVVNFVADQTIEHGMLSLYQFKKALFSGVLEKADDEVLMEGSRLGRFMKAVESVTETAIQNPQGQKSDVSTKKNETIRSQVGASSSHTTLNFLIETGISFLSGVQKSLANGEGSSERPLSGRFGVKVDQKTGQRSLEIPLPDRPTLDRLVQTINSMTILLKQKEE